MTHQEDIIKQSKLNNDFLLIGKMKKNAPNPTRKLFFYCYKFSKKKKNQERKEQVVCMV